MSSNALPTEWVDRIWSKLTVRYGRAFLARWDGVDLAEVKADWAQELGGFASDPRRIAYALDNLPADKPPTVGEFAAAANRMVETVSTPRLDYKSGPIQADVMRALDRLKEPREIHDQYSGPKGWAYRLRDREDAGERLGVVQRRFWREALRAETAEVDA